jgi:hypothetical protein
VDFKIFLEKHRAASLDRIFALVLNHYHLILATTFFIRRMGIKYNQLAIGLGRTPPVLGAAA